MKFIPLSTTITAHSCTDSKEDKNMMVEFKQAHLEAEYKEAGYAHIIANGYICRWPSNETFATALACGEVEFFIPGGTWEPVPAQEFEEPMHEEYLAQVKFAFAPTRWANAIWHTSPTAKRYAKTMAEAQEAIQTLENRYPNDPQQQVIESRIRIRMVTDWEEVEG